MTIDCKVIDLNERPGQESLRVSFPKRTGQVLTLALSPDELKRFKGGEAMTAELTAPPEPKKEPAEKGKPAGKEKVK